MRNVERSQPGSEYEPVPDLQTMLVHNQEQWRARKKGIGVFSSPIEVKPGPLLLGSNLYGGVTAAFGEYIHPAHKANPPLVGVSVFVDLPDLEITSMYWKTKTSLLNSDNDAHAFNEAKVSWLTEVAKGRNPTKIRLIDRYGMKAVRDFYERFINVCGSGVSVERLTDILARHHFQGSNDQIEAIFPQFFPEKPVSFTDFVHHSVISSPQIEKDQRAFEDDTSNIHKFLVPTAKVMVQLYSSIMMFQQFGSTIIPGIVNLEMKVDMAALTSILATLALSGNGRIVPALIMSLSANFEMNLLPRKRAYGMHEIIHAMGITETHDQGFPTSWSLRDYKQI